MSQHVIIIGAGPGGLAAALLLRSAGLQVTVFEKQDRPGGRTSALDRDGFRFDRGPTFFLYPQVLRDIFNSIGHELEDEVEMIRLDPQYHVMFEDGGDIRATADVEAMRRQIAAICPKDAGAFEGFMRENRAKFAAFKPCLEQPFESWRDTVNPRMAKLLPQVRPWQSVDGELRKHFTDPRVRLAFSFQSKYLGMSPFRCPGLFTILSYLEYEYGVYHPIGGCAAVSEAMARLAVRHGVDIRYNMPVTQILVEQGRTTGVQTRDDRHRADAVVLNADFAQAMTDLLPDAARRRWSNRKLAKKRYSCSTFMMYLGIKGRCDHLAHHTIYLSSDYENNLREIEHDHVLSESPSFYLQNACVTDPSLAPQDKSTLYVLVPVTHQHPNVDWSTQRERYRELVLKRLHKVGLEDLTDRIEYEHVVTPDDWARLGPIYRGATFNLTHNFGQMLHLRPHNRFEDVPGMYLVGGGTHPGSGLPVIFESALISSRLLLEDLGLSDRWSVLESAKHAMQRPQRRQPSPPRAFVS